MDFVSSKAGLVAHLNSDTQSLLRCLTSPNKPLPEAFFLPETDAFMHLLECHRLSTVFYHSINKDEPAFGAVKDPLSTRYLTSKFRMLANVAELCRVLKLLKQKGIDAIALKGPVLGQLYYNDPTQRECNDLDILVKPADVEDAFDLLLVSGYQLASVLWNSPKQKKIYRETFYHFNLYNTTAGIQLELHWRLNTSVETYKTDDIWRSLIAQKIGGFDIPFLSREINFIYLCIHGSTHDWKRLFWVQDIAQIIDKEGPAFLMDTYQQACIRHVQRYMLAGCTMASVLFNSDLPPLIVEAIKADPKIGKVLANFIFTINHITDPYESSLSSFQSFKRSAKKLINYYKSTYYFGGFKALFLLVKRFFINPDYWAIYSFRDNLFVLNYLMAPFLWVYAALIKRKNDD